MSNTWTHGSASLSQIVVSSSSKVGTQSRIRENRKSQELSLAHHALATQYTAAVTVIIVSVGLKITAEHGCR